MIAAPPPPCIAAQLAPSLGPLISEATGQHTLPIRLRNRSSHACLLDGYPVVTIHDRAGTIPFAIAHRGDQMLTGRGPRPVVVAPGRSAWVVANNFRCDLGDVRTGTVVEIRWSGSRRSVAIDSSRRPVEYCGPGDPGSTLDVTPFEPSLRAAFQR